jgi:hypothetical protein
MIEIAELSGVDPTDVIVDPQPPPAEPPFKFSFSGKDDLTNVLVLAFMIAKGETPTPEHIEQAKQMIIAAGTPLAPPQMPEGQPDGSLPAGQEGEEPPPPGDSPAGPTPVPEGGSDAFQDWHTADKIAKRSRDTEA